MERAAASPPPNTFVSRNPNTGEVLGEIPMQDASDVERAVARATRAAAEWGALSFAERRRHLVAWRREIARRQDDFIELIHKENGKIRADAAAEVFATLYHLNHAAARAAKVLGPRRAPSGLLPNLRATISYHPLGVVGVIGPWNMPMFTPMGSIAYALAAGNAVVFKPSELTPLVGKLLAETAAVAIPIHGLFEIVTGMGVTGAALAGAKGIQKVAFTGSAATGRKVMRAASENLTPVLMELGGKDPMIIAEDADLDSAAKHAAWGGFCISGQACISVERCYVVESVYEDFVARLTLETRDVTIGTDNRAQIGAMTRPEQPEHVRAQLEDAVAKGARVLVGGVEGIDGNRVPPTLLVDVTDEMDIMREETFGPVIPVIRVRDTDEAVRLANQTSFGLGSSVFSQHRGEAIAEKIRAGMTSINTMWAYALNPNLPFGGIGESGFGRIHGDEGLREFAHVKATAHQRFGLPLNPVVFQRDGSTLHNIMRKATKQLFGGGALDTVMTAFGSLRKRS